MKLTPEQLEALIVQAVDGTIGPMDRTVLDEHLAVDAEARQLLEEHRALAAALRSLPGADFGAIDFGALSQKISAAVEAEPAHVSQPLKMVTSWTRWLSIAAVVTLLAGVGFMAIPKASTPTDPGTDLGAVATGEQKPAPAIEAPPLKKLDIEVAGMEQKTAPKSIITVGTEGQQPGSNGKIDIAVGPTDEMSQRGKTYGLADDALNSSAPKVSIHSSPTTAPAVDDRF